MERLPGTLLENGSVELLGVTVTTDQYQTMVMDLMFELNAPTVILLVLYCLVFLLAAVSNALVIVVIYRFQHLRRSVDSRQLSFSRTKH